MAIAMILLGAACSPFAVANPPPGRAALFGRLRLEPKQGAPQGGAGAYGSRRFRHVESVDYERPGFAVVHVDAPAGPPGVLVLTLHENPRGEARLTPTQAAIGLGARIRLQNQTARVQALSSPALGLLRSLPAGAELEVVAQTVGALDIHLPAHGREADALVYVAPGRFAQTDAAGYYEIDDLEPGARRLTAWQPRFGALEARVELRANERTEWNPILGVDHMEHPTGGNQP